MSFEQVLSYAKSVEYMIGDARIVSDDDGVILFDNGDMYYYSQYERYMVGSA